MRKPQVPSRLAPNPPGRGARKPATSASPNRAPKPTTAPVTKLPKRNVKSPKRLGRPASALRGSRKALLGGSRLRRGVIFTSLGSFVALVALVFAVLFTPMMAIEEIKISGTDRLSAKSIRNTVQNLMGKSLAMVNEAEIADRLRGFALIESFTTVSLPPHTLEIVIAERQPIGVVTFGGTDYLYDAAGVQVGLARSSDRYPQIITEGDPRRSSQYRSAIDVLLALPARLLPDVASIQATSKDDVRLRLRGNSRQQILWGDSSQSALKAKVLDALMANTRKSASVTFDVSSPTAPTVRY